MSSSRADPDREADRLCPSAPARVGGSVVIGVRLGVSGGARIVPTDKPIPVTQQIIDFAAPLEPGEVFRFAANCESAVCPHFVDRKCQIAVGAVARLDEVVTELPRCSIRSQCRWFRQEGPPICLRCPQIVTQEVDPTPEMIDIVNHRR